MTMSTLSFSEKLFGTTVLDGDRALLAKKTYALLLVSVAMAGLGGYTCVTSPAMMSFFFRPVGWIVALVLLNVVPYFALWASRQNPGLGIVALAADGFVSGLALGPLLAIAAYVSPGTIPAALAVTGGVFVAVTAYVMFSKEKFSAPAGLLTGMFFALILAMFVNMFIQMTALGLVITIGIGIFGVVSLVYATSDVLNNPDYDNPVQGALMLFAALFNVFVTALRLLLRARD
jgi:modulator of FtsH protease